MFRQTQFPGILTAPNSPQGAASPILGYPHGAHFAPFSANGFVLGSVPGVSSFLFNILVASVLKKQSAVGGQQSAVP